MDIDAFIARWTSREGGAERANYQMFLAELCDVLGVARPDPAGAERERNDYVFERAVRPRGDESRAPRRIDLYKCNAFILEAKQMRLPGRDKALSTEAAIPFFAEPERLGKRSIARGWDVMMQNARKQAEAYVFLLDADHAAPPFVIACDVGHCLELYADFTGTGRSYHQFPDRNGFRIYLDDLRHEEVRARLAAVWTDPHGLDPSRIATRVTRDIARRLAAVSRRLEAAHPPEDVAHFLMRCIFTMFAEGVGLLPKGAFSDLLSAAAENPSSFEPLVGDLWRSMDEERYEKRYCVAVRAHLRHFNGNLFKRAAVFALGAEEIGELLKASRHDWRRVDPAIFGTLLEQALDAKERRRLGAHYTPRAYVERIVNMTVMEPLHADWQAARMMAEAATKHGDRVKAVAAVRAFHRALCETRVLDPACGTGNFLYVALEMMKQLEGDVLETLAELGEAESMGLDRETVDPHQFLGLELNPRAAAIAELVVWIGYLQQHYRTRSGHPAEPILRAFRNINFGQGEGYDAVLARDGGSTPRCPDWPEAEFIVGNPPFIGKGATIRSALGDSYIDALKAAYPRMNPSADFVMYWWDRSAELLTMKGSVLRRFGFVTTNSISQIFNRRVMERHLVAEPPVSVVFAVPDHPWTKATEDAAAVRIAMTVALLGRHGGLLQEVVQEFALDTDEPQLLLSNRFGDINADLTIGPNLTRVELLRANQGLSWNGMMLAGQGFVVTQAEAADISRNDNGASGPFLKPFLNGADLVRKSRERFVIDFFGQSAADARTNAPAAYAHLLATVKPSRDTSRDRAFREHWWTFGRSRPDLRKALEETRRFIGTTETSKHRLFQFLPSDIVPDHMVIAIAVEDASLLSVLSSRLHVTWANATGGWLGVGNDPRYSKSRCFDPFPFPEPTATVEAHLRDAGEELDATRKRVLARHPDLTLTGLYNVLEKLRAGLPLSAKEEDVKRRGLVLILKELHETIDRLAAESYGWPVDLGEEEILARLVALNAERAREEAAGEVRWLRAAYQEPRFGRAAARAAVLRPEDGIVAFDRGLDAFPSNPYEAPLAVERLLRAAAGPMNAADLARRFRRGGRRIEAKIDKALETLADFGRIAKGADGRYEILGRGTFWREAA